MGVEREREREGCLLKKAGRGSCTFRLSSKLQSSAFLRSMPYGFGGMGTRRTYLCLCIMNGRVDMMDNDEPRTFVFGMYDIRRLHREETKRNRTGYGGLV